MRSLAEQLDSLEQEALALEPDSAERDALTSAATGSAGRFLDSLDGIRVFNEPAPGTGALAEAIAEHGLGLERALQLLERDVVTPGLQPAHPGHMAFIPGGGLYHAALGDYLAAVSNKFSGVFFSGPGAVRLENRVLRWVADLVGYPSDAAGHIASGGSLATLTALVTARDAHGLRAAEYGNTVAYLTGHTHHAVDKALRIAGLGEVQVRRVAVDDRFRMRPDRLEEAIRRDRAQGLRPWLVVATAGTTDTGAVDPLLAIADVAQRERCWLHVDAAYGGFFLLTRHGETTLRGIERSDSVILDPHKSLFLPWGSGIVLVRRRSDLLRTHSYTGHYMQDAAGDPGEVSPADVSPELTRPFRALRMWLPLATLGVRPFRAALEEKLLLARYFRERIQQVGYTVGPEPDLSIVTFRLAPAGRSLEESNRRNERLVEEVRRDGRVFFSSTLLDGVFTLRMVALSFRTHRRHVDQAIEVLATLARRI